MGCHREQTYLMMQSVLQCLIRQRSDESAVKRLSWLLESEASKRHRDVSRYSVYFCHARNYPLQVDAMRAILSEQALVQQYVDVVGGYETLHSPSPPHAVSALHFTRRNSSVFLIRVGD